MTRTGYYGSVEWTPQGWRLVHGDWPEFTTLVVSDINGATLASQPTSWGGLNFIRTAVSPAGVIAFIAQSHKSFGPRAITGLIQPDLSISVELTGWPAFGQCGVNVAWVNGSFRYFGMIDGFNYYQVIDGVRSAPIANPFPVEGTSQGWIDVYNGDLRWIDLNRDDRPQQLLFPTSRAGVTMGQNAFNPSYEGDYIAGFSPTNARFMAVQELGQEITVSVNDVGNQWAWCARLSNGRFGFGTLPPFPAAPTVVDPPPPIDPPEDPTMPDLDHLLRDRSALVKQLRQQLFGVDENTPLNSAEKAFLLTRHVAWTLRAEGWGVVKAKAGSENNVGGYTSDVIALADGEHVDVVSASGEHSGSAWIPARHQPGWAQSWNDAIRPRWEAPTDPGGVVVPPVDPPDDPDQPPPPDNEDLEVFFRALMEEYQALVADEFRLLRNDMTQLTREVAKLQTPAAPAVTFPNYKSDIDILGRKRTITFKPEV